MLIGWHLAEGQVDSGLPRELRAILAQALTSIGIVSFPCCASSVGELPTSPHCDSTMPTRGTILTEWARSTFTRKPVKVALVSTRQEATAAALFEDSNFPWHLQGQVAILSALDANPSNLDRDAVLSLIDDQWTTLVAQFNSRDFAGVVRPGVDGDIVCVWSRTTEFASRIAQSIEREARQDNFDWAIVSESDFESALAGSRELIGPLHQNADLPAGT